MNGQSGIIGDLNEIMGFEPNMALGSLNDLRQKKKKKKMRNGCRPNMALHLRES